MASDAQPSNIDIVLAGWRDALRAIKQMMLVVGAAFLLTVIAQAAYRLSRGHSFPTDFAMFLLLSIAQTLVLTPLAVAVHRYVLLDELTQHYALNRADQRFRRYFGLAIAIRALWLSNALWFILPHYIFGGPLLASRWSAPGVEGREWIMFVSFAGAMATTFITLCVILDVVILFPAIAIDAPGVGWRNATDDSRGHTYRIFSTLGPAVIIPLFPFAIVELILGLQPEGLGSWLTPHPAIQVIGVVLRAAELVLMVSVFAAVASRLYMALGRRIRGVAPVD